MQATSILQAALGLIAIYRQIRAQVTARHPDVDAELLNDAAVIALFLQDAETTRVHLEALIARHRE